MCSRFVKLSLFEISSLNYYPSDNNKLLVFGSNESRFKYFRIPFNLNFRKEKQNLFFSTFIEKEFILTRYLNNFIYWLKNNNKSFKKKLFLKGLGFRIFLSDDKTQICFKIGFSHLIQTLIPKNITNVIIEKNSLVIEGSDIADVGNFSKQIKQLKLPDIYKGKGFSYKNEVINLKPIKKN